MKLQAKSLSIEHRTNLPETLEDTGKGPYANQIWNIKFREDTHDLDLRIKYIEGKIRNIDTSFVTLTVNDGTVEINQSEGTIGTNNYERKN